MILFCAAGGAGCGEVLAVGEQRVGEYGAAVVGDEHQVGVERVNERRLRRSSSSDLGVATVLKVVVGQTCSPDRRLSVVGFMVRFIGSGSDAGKVRYT